MAVPKRSFTDMLLGLFVAGAIGLIVTFIFLLGQERRLFESTNTIRAEFPSVAGLRVGAEVLVGGVAVGKVSDIEFPPNKRQGRSPKITVYLQVSRSMMPQIRKDSVVRIDSEGLLGDKIINISLGSADEPVKDGDMLPMSETNLDLNARLSEVQKSFGSAIQSVTKTADLANKILEGFVGQGGEKALASFVESMRSISKEIESGGGIVHKLIYDKKAGADFQASLASLQDTIASIKTTTHRVDNMLSEVENGQGLLHGLIYDKNGAQTISHASALFKELAEIAGVIQNGDGILHTLIYDYDNGNFVKDLNAMSADLRKIVSRVQSGEGTIGRLLIDPTIYEDLKLILSDVKRNKVLKTLIRFGISAKGTPSE